MPVNFLTPSQRERYGRYPEILTHEEIARYFYLDDDDHALISSKRKDVNRLGYALQLTTVRFLGTFLDDVCTAPLPVITELAKQLNVINLNCLAEYKKGEQRWRHMAEIRLHYGYREFVTEGIRFRLGRWLCALCWTGTDRPSVLFEHASSWLITHKVLLPGVTVLERYVAEIRSRMETRLWRALTRNITTEQRYQLDQLLVVDEGNRQSRLDKLRKGPTRVSGPALVAALRRIEIVRSLGIRLPMVHVPPSRIASLARFASTSKVTAISRLANDRRLATLVAFVHSLEATAQDDALYVLDMLLRDLFGNAEHADRKARLRSIKDLDRAATTLADACQFLLDTNLPSYRLREHVYAEIGQAELTKALADVSALVRPPDDVFYLELKKKQETVKRFLPTLLRVIHFHSNAAGEPLRLALDWLCHRPDHDPPVTVLSKAWHRYAINDEGKVDPIAFTFGTLDMLKTALRRRDVFVLPSWRYADPRAGLLSGAEWHTAKPIICRALDISIDPKVALAALSQELDQTYRAVATRLPDNPAVKIEMIDGKDELILSPLDKLDEPVSLIALRKEVKARMPRVDLPEILLEIAARTKFTDAFTHLTESNARVTDIVTSLCAVLLAQACNTGPEPFTRQDTPALRRDRLMWIDQNYIRDDTLVTANGILVAAQSQIALAQLWGGGDVASADGMRLVVPIRSVHVGPNPKYFHRDRGVTWYNLISDQRSGLNSITVPGTLRDSLVLLAVVLEQQTELQPTRIMTDTGAYNDIVFGLFRLLGYRFSPRLADIGGSRFWRIDRKADYGQLNGLARQFIMLNRIEPHWDDILRLIGSLKMGLVPATGIMRTLQAGDRPTRLAQAIAEIGRIDKTIHTLNYIDDESRRRSTLLQLNLGEGRHSLARDIFHGKRGELHQRYREGQEDQLSALGLVVNIVVLWNTIYTDAILAQLRAEGYQVQDEDAVRLSPFGHEHINMLGRYSFSVPDAVARGELRPFRTPTDP